MNFWIVDWRVEGCVVELVPLAAVGSPGCGVLALWVEVGSGVLDPFIVDFFIYVFILV